MSEKSTAVQAWSEPFQIKENLSMRPIDVKRLLGLEHVTINETVLFLNKCKQYGADPFMNDMHMIKYSEKSPASIVTGVGFFQKKAAANPRFKGYGQTQWLTDFKDTESGRLEWVDFWLPKIHGKYPLACRATCYIEGYEKPQTFTVNWDENVKTKDEWKDRQRTGKKIVNSTWDGMASRMLEKDAIVGLLRAVLPEDVGGLYISEEITGEVMPEAKPDVKKLEMDHSTDMANYYKDPKYQIDDKLKVTEGVDSFGQERTPPVETPEPEETHLVCGKCNDMIPLNDYAQHSKLCNPTPELVTIHCDFCEQLIEDHLFEKHIETCKAEQAKVAAAQSSEATEAMPTFGQFDPENNDDLEIPF